MSMPKFPSDDSSLNREDVINQIISSIAMEELGLSHIINAEGEKLQYALGTLDGVTGPEEPATIDDLLALNQSVRETLDSATQNQIFLKAKLQNALSSAVMQGPTGPEGPTGEDGKSAYELAVEEGFTGTLDEWLESLQGGPAGPAGPKGDTGDQGPQGNPGVTPHIDTGTGNWFIGDVDTGVPAQGPQGDPGGTPHIDSGTGNWFIGDVDTGVPAQGPKGDPGITPTITVGATETVEYPADAEVTQGGTPTNVVLDFKIPRGQQGPAGQSIRMLGSFTSYSDFSTQHPTGNPGDTWLVEGYLRTWDAETGTWLNLGDLTGDTGPQGIPGEKGDTGNTGADGEAATIEIVDVTTVACDQDATVTNIGDEHNAKFELDIPRGCDGADGLSAYQIAVEHGFTGTEEEWLDSLSDRPKSYHVDLTGTTSSTYIDIPLKNVIYRFSKSSETLVQAYIRAASDPVFVDYKRVSVWDSNAQGSQGNALTLTTTPHNVDDGLYVASREVQILWLRQRDPVTQAYSLCVVYYLSGGTNAERTDIWVKWIDEDFTYATP